MKESKEIKLTEKDKKYLRVLQQQKMMVRNRRLAELREDELK